MNIAPFKRKISDVQRQMETELARGDFNPYDIMIWRDAIDLATLQLQDHPEIALSFKKQRAAGGTAEDRWLAWIVEQSVKFRDPSVGKPDDFRLRKTQYLLLVPFQSIRVAQSDSPQVFVVFSADAAQDICAAAGSNPSTRGTEPALSPCSACSPSPPRLLSL